jgi:hypothetical protein
MLKIQLLLNFVKKKGGGGGGGGGGKLEERTGKFGMLTCLIE